jgi:glycosyltransferase involved in cell wall biosynthesis
MRIVVVGLGLFGEMTGGSARYLSGMTQAMRRNGHEVEVVTAVGLAGDSSGTERGWIGQVVRTIRRAVLVHPRAVATVVRSRPDVVNVHFAFDGLGAVLVARLLRIPIVVMFQGPWAREAVATGHRGTWPLSSRLRRFIELRVYRSASRCIVLSGAFREVLATEYGVPLERIRVIPAGIETSAFESLLDREDARRRVGLPASDGFTLVTVRRLVARMGLDLLLRAVARLEDRDVRLAIAGTGPERSSLEDLADRLGLGGRVAFMGKVPDADLAAFYAAGDLCVVPTRELEGFGYVALESLAAGTPVLATAVGGLVDLVGAFAPRRLVAADPASLAAGIAEAMVGPLEDRLECRRYAAQFDWQAIAPRVEAVFREARAS